MFLCFQECSNQLVHKNKISSSVRDRKKDGHLCERGLTQL